MSVIKTRGRLITPFFCLVEEDKFKHPIGMRLNVTGGKMFELDLIALLFEKVFRRWLHWKFLCEMYYYLVDVDDKLSYSKSFLHS